MAVQIASRALVVSTPGEPLRVSGVGAGVTALCRGIVDESGSPVVDPAERLRSGDRLERLGAPFAALLVDGDHATMAADHVGFRHVYGTQQQDWAAVSTSAHELAQQSQAETDLAALSVFRLAGHYLDDDTAYVGVRKLPAAHSFALSNGQLQLNAYPQRDPGAGDYAVADHARRLRDLVSGFLDHHPDAMIELSGGLDSRLVLAAVAPRRRGHLTAFTIIDPESKDGLVAAALARQYGMRSQTVEVAGLASLEPQQAYELASAAALRLDGLGRPLAAAVFHWAESQIEQVPRLSGHGGEMARALFEFERPHPTVRVDVVENYIRRWIVANDAVKDDVLTPEFAAESRDLGMHRLREVFSRQSSDWISALSLFYLRQRMQRWAGMIITDGCQSRVTLNPLMDSEVLAYAGAVPARLRKGSRYVVRVLDRLDPELARIPLGSGLRPVALDRPVTLTRRMGENTVSGFLRKAGSKVVRTLSSRTRSASGAPMLAALVAAHWRENPSLLDPVAKTGFVSQEWLTRLVDGSVAPDATTVDFLLDLAVIVDRSIAR